MKEATLHNPGGIVASPGVLAVLTGVSGSGKDSVLDELEALGHSFERIVTVTTRPPRETEREGKDYHFWTNERFEEAERNGYFLETAVVHSEDGTNAKRYGTPLVPIREALDSGKDVVLRIDPQGTRTIHDLVPGAVLIFLEMESTDPNYQRDRLRQRGTDSPEIIERRLESAMRERTVIPMCSHLVVNRFGRLRESAEIVRGILLAERCRINRPSVQLPST